MAFEGKAKNRNLPIAKNIPKKVAQRSGVGNGGGDGRANDLVTLWQKNKHKERVKDHVQNGSQSNAVTGGFGLPCASDQMCQHR